MNDTAVSDTDSAEDTAGFQREARAFLSCGFTYNQRAARVLMRPHALEQLPAEVDALGIRRALVIAGSSRPALSERAGALLGARCVGIFDKAVMHVPVEVVQAVHVVASRAQADGIVAIGGGSPIGLAKALAIDTELPIVAVPTTYAGSEMTALYGITENGYKRTGKNPRVQPKTVIYDPELSRDLPLQLSITSGLNAIAHAVEGLYAWDANPISSIQAEEGIRALSAGLRDLPRSLHDATARAACLYGAWLCGCVLGSVEMGLHHKICHVLGGTWNLPHSDTHAVLLPHVFAFNAPAAPESAARVARALGVEDSATGLFALCRDIAAPASLKAIGMPEDGLARAVEIISSSSFHNPRPASSLQLRQLLDAAYRGHDVHPSAWEG